MDEMLQGDNADELLKKYTKKEPTDSQEFNPYGAMDPSSDIAMCCGCTACVVLIADDKLYCANAGDSRCVLSKGGEAYAMSQDHKPSNTQEEDRIK